MSICCFNRFWTLKNINRVLPGWGCDFTPFALKVLAKVDKLMPRSWLPPLAPASKSSGLARLPKPGLGQSYGRYSLRPRKPGRQSDITMIPIAIAADCPTARLSVATAVITNMRKNEIMISITRACPISPLGTVAPDWRLWGTAVAGYSPL